MSEIDKPKRTRTNGLGHESPLCESFNRFGFPCGAIAIAGTNPRRCKYHGGRQQKQIDSHIYGTQRMSKWYSRKIGPKLAEVLQSAGKFAQDEVLNVNEEIALMREACGTFIEIHSALVESNAKPEAIATSAMGMMHALQQVVEVCTKAQKANDKAKMFTPGDLRGFAAQITACIWEVLGEDYNDMAAQIVNLIEERVQIPQEKDAARYAPTSLKSADTAVRELDDTVPYVPDDDDNTEEVGDDGEVPT